MEVNYPFVFQTDSTLINEVYSNEPNYLVDYNHHNPKAYCVLYFSSNDLYYPNTETALREQVLKKNRFEWYGKRINRAYKHIFLRDIKKQWYLTGVNKHIDTPEKLFHFLKSETEGYKVIALGSSAGGFAAVLFGQLLNAECIFTFNGQFEIASLLEKPNAEIIDPVIFRNKDNKNLTPYYNISKFITNADSIYYFHSNKSLWDIEQWEEIKNIPVNKISFATTNHGIPFLKSNLSAVLNLSIEELKKLSGKTMHPLTFSLKIVGFVKTIEGLQSIFQFALNKIYIKTIQKWKSNK